MSNFTSSSIVGGDRYTVLEDVSPASSSYPKPSVQIGGAADKALALTDLAYVAAGCKVSVAESLLGAIASVKTGEPLGNDVIEAKCAEAASSSQAALNFYICRAGMAARLTSLSFGRCKVREDVLNLMVVMLNEGVVPAFTSVTTAGMELILALTGSDKGKVYTGDDGEKMASASSALKGKGLEPVQLSAGEVDILRGCQFLSTGAACLIAEGASNVFDCLEGVSALSCEAIGVATMGFQAEHFEIARQHRGQMEAATNLRMMLEGSRQVSAKRMDDNDKGDMSAFVGIPQNLGPGKDALATATKALDVELNSSELNPGVSVMDPTPAVLNLQLVSGAMYVALVASTERTHHLQGSAVGALAPPPQLESFFDFAAVYAQLKALEATVVNEARAASAVLDSLTKKLEEEAAAKAKAKEGAESQAAAKAAELAAKIKETEASYTPEQRAKAEAARKKKEEKAAAKKAAKDNKKSATLTLGAGSSQLREYLKSGGTMDIFNGRDGLGAFMASLLEKLDSSGSRKPKVAKGTRDYGPEQMRIREQVFSSIRRIFKRHGGVEIDTPVFELKEVLTGKYGEDTKLIYDLADQGGEILALRYDLTVPFARYLAMNSVGNIKRYHIAKVYRRDQPQLSRGRYREFYQCDFDIAGNYAPMVADAEAITIATEILTELPVGKFCVKLNHRVLLDAIFEICGVPPEKFRPICSAVDKLDKAPWEEVRREMVEEKGLDMAAAEKIGTFVLNADEPMALWKRFTEENTFGDHVKANEALASMKTLFDYLEAMGSIQYVSFDMSLARGLDYYTGVIYEMVIMEGTTRVGSIAAGGRYDNLVGMFSVSGTQTPCVGVSIGIERVFTIIENKAIEKKLMGQSDIQVYIASIGDKTLSHRMRIARELWTANICSEYSHKENPKLKPQMDEVLERGIPFMIVFGEDEVEKGVVKVKNMDKHEEVEVQLGDLAAALMGQGCLQLSTSGNGLLEALK